MEKLNELIATCVLQGVLFAGKLGTQSYNVQDVVHSLGERTINEMWQTVNKSLKSLETDSLFQSGGESTKRRNLQLQADTLAAVFEYKRLMTAKEKARAEAKAQATAKLALLKHIKDEKEMDAYKGMTLEQIEEEIAKAESL